MISSWPSYKSAAFNTALSNEIFLCGYLEANKYPNCIVYINNSHHLARKYARIFVRGHYLFREANSFPRAKLEEICELRGTDNVQGQISQHIFAPNGGCCLYYPSNLFPTRAVKTGKYLTIRLRARVFYKQIVNEVQPG